MPLGTEVGLDPGDIVFRWGPSSPLQKGAEQPPQFSAHVLLAPDPGDSTENSSRLFVAVHL